MVIVLSQTNEYSSSDTTSSSIAGQSGGCRLYAQQSNIDASMRCTVVEWLIEVVEEFCSNGRHSFCVWISWTNFWPWLKRIDVSCSCLVLQRCLLLCMYCIHFYYCHNAIHSMVCAVTKNTAVHVSERMSIWPKDSHIELWTDHATDILHHKTRVQCSSSAKYNRKKHMFIMDDTVLLQVSQCIKVVCGCCFSFHVHAWVSE